MAKANSARKINSAPSTTESNNISPGVTNTGKVDKSTAQALLQQAQDGFVRLQAMAAAAASLILHSKHGEEDDDLANATNLLFQLQKNAMMLADASDIVRLKGGAS